MSKVFTVFGATGNQGGSVIKSILENTKLSKEFKLRGVSRDVSKPAATALKEKGVEMVAADLNDPASVKKAVEGAAVVFAVTNFWEKMSYDNEVEQGKNIVNAAKAAGVERLIWSSLVNVSKESHGKITQVRHFDSKAAVEQYARDEGVPSTFFMPGLFMSFGLQSLRKDEDGVYKFRVPFDAKTTKIPLFDPADDAGLFVAAILLHGESTLGKRVPAASAYVTPEEMVKGFSEVTGEKAETVRITYEQFGAALPPAAEEELTANFKLLEDPGYYVGEPADALDKSVELVESAGLRQPVSWTDYVKKHFKA